MNTTLRLFLWNDDVTTLERWKMVAEKYEVVATSNTDVNSVVNEYRSKRCDLVLLDLMHGDSPLGRDIGLRIRKEDPLVPIVVVTRFPGKAYSNLGGISSLRLAGIHASEIMEDLILEERLLRPALSVWHTSHPDFILVREAIYSLNEISNEQTGLKASTSVTDSISELICGLQQLCFTGRRDSWHSQMTGLIGDLLSNNEVLNSFAGPYSKIASHFRDADPFFMAAPLGRRHLSHNVQVFLLGLVILLNDSTLIASAISDVSSSLVHSKPNLPSGDILFIAILLWGCVSTTHDVAYLSERLNRVVDHLNQACGRFAPFVAQIASSSSVNITLDVSKWPSIHHSVVASAMWKELVGSDTDALTATLVKKVSKAILRHDSSQPNRGPVSSTPEEWLDYLAVLCDELQDWSRERAELLPGNDSRLEIPWRSFAVEAIRVSSKPGEGTKLGLRFAAEDYIAPLTDAVGLQGKNNVTKRLGEIISVLRKNLKHPMGCQISLTVDFVNRAIAPSSRNVTLH